MIQTDDIFLGALSILKGGELVSVDVRGGFGRRVAVFSIGGVDASQLEHEFYRGESRLSVRLLKSEVKRLKDAAFGAIREEESRHAREQGRARTDQVREPHRAARR